MIKMPVLMKMYVNIRFVRWRDEDHIDTYLGWKTLHKKADPVPTADPTEEDDADDNSDDDPTDCDAFYMR